MAALLAGAVAQLPKARNLFTQTIDPQASVVSPTRPLEVLSQVRGGDGFFGNHLINFEFIPLALPDRFSPKFFRVSTPLFAVLCV